MDELWDGPWECVIRVVGALAPRWATRLRGLRIVPAAGGGDGEVLTELRGELPDQAAVYEVLRTLHAHGLRLRQVTCVPRRPPAPGG
jgi:hypothetical protein